MRLFSTYKHSWIAPSQCMKTFTLLFIPFDFSQLWNAWLSLFQWYKYRSRLLLYRRKMDSHIGSRTCRESQSSQWWSWSWTLCLYLWVASLLQNTMVLWNNICLHFRTAALKSFSERFPLWVWVTWDLCGQSQEPQYNHITDEGVRLRELRWLAWGSHG